MYIIDSVYTALLHLFSSLAWVPQMDPHNLAGTFSARRQSILLNCGPFCQLQKLPMGNIPVQDSVKQTEQIPSPFLLLENK